MSRKWASTEMSNSICASNMTSKFHSYTCETLKNGQNDLVLIFDCVSQTFYTRDASVFIAVAGLHSEKNRTYPNDF